MPRLVVITPQVKVIQSPKGLTQKHANLFPAFVLWHNLFATDLFLGL